jgi:hypothetical protein
MLRTELFLDHLFQRLHLPLERRVFLISIAEKPPIPEDFEDFLLFFLADPFKTRSWHIAKPPVRFNRG